MRNIGGSIGISIGENVLVRSIQTNHAWIAEHANPYNPMLQHARRRSTRGTCTRRAGLAALNAEITRQAAMIAYIDVFKLLMVMTLALIPLLLHADATRAAPRSKAAQRSTR